MASWTSSSGRGRGDGARGGLVGPDARRRLTTTMASGMAVARTDRGSNERGSPRALETSKVCGNLPSVLYV